MDKIVAPWSPQEVDALNRFQERFPGHPFTCPNHSNVSLIAEEEGWYCPLLQCSYTQTWAHAVMVEFHAVLWVVHCRKQAYDVYIGRPSKWGNPFEIGKDGTREEVIRKYEAWLPKQPELMAALGELKEKILGCWCAPLQCHGHVLARFAHRWG